MAAQVDELDEAIQSCLDFVASTSFKGDRTQENPGLMLVVLCSHAEAAKAVQRFVNAAKAVESYFTNATQARLHEERFKLDQVR